MYCATDDEETIEQGVKRVKQILSENYVRPDEAETVKSKVRERGRFNTIDRIDTANITAIIDRVMRSLYQIFLISDQISCEEASFHSDRIGG
jgi:ATP-dependent Lon protease